MKEVVVSGMGVHTSIGFGTETFWSGLLQGACGIGTVGVFDVSGHNHKRACEIKRMQPSAYFQDQVSGMGRTTGIVTPAVEEALQDAGLAPDGLSDYRVGLCIGTTMGEIEPLEKTLSGEPVDTAGGPHTIAAHLSRLLRLSGPRWTFTNACSAGNFAIARCMEELRLGRADIMIASGVDSLSWVAFTGFASLRAMSPDVCRPFDRKRQGLILGEGAGVLVLETREHAEKRRAQVKATLLGYGLCCDAHHITQPDPSAKGAVRAMRQALAMSGLTPGDISHVSAHGTGTIANDQMETKAIGEVFAGSGRTVTVNSIKGHIGHTLGAASAIEAVMAVKAIETGLFPPTLHTEDIDPLCTHDSVRLNRSVRSEPVEAVLSNSYAFGGINSSIVLAGPKGGRAAS
ncbi:beta-ketoacyl-[acyl-carrier-protein] synthase family protein [Paenibacillus elgii]|uniref:beta-ketoacyl-[acyl-carrier-protein] synthase family protein n=1 Tax=Paenibacillus elgii TaxID=189691 RepID=UPI0013D70E12|nr:beta-ketoacyl-[acyl-carrier-protein] synthase family protein [Paenibacillus elgii]